MERESGADTGWAAAGTPSDVSGESGDCEEVSLREGSGAAELDRGNALGGGETGGDAVASGEVAERVVVEALDTGVELADGEPEHEALADADADGDSFVVADTLGAGGELGDSIAEAVALLAAVLVALPAGVPAVLDAESTNVLMALAVGTPLRLAVGVFACVGVIDGVPHTVSAMWAEWQRVSTGEHLVQGLHAVLPTRANVSPVQNTGFRFCVPREPRQYAPAGQGTQTLPRPPPPSSLIKYFPGAQERGAWAEEGAARSAKSMRVRRGRGIWGSCCW